MACDRLTPSRTDVTAAGLCRRDASRAILQALLDAANFGVDSFAFRLQGFESKRDREDRRASRSACWCFNLDPTLRFDERLFGELCFAIRTTSRLAEDELERSMFFEHTRDDEAERYIRFIIAASLAPGDL